MINLSNLSAVATSVARAALGESNTSKINHAFDVASHIAGQTALRVGNSLLEQINRLNERQQQGLSEILKALRGEKPVDGVHTHSGGGLFKLARAAFDVVSVVWERDKLKPHVMSFLKALDSQGKTLFSLGKEMAKAFAESVQGPDKNNGKTENSPYASFASKVGMSKVIQRLFNESGRPGAERVRRPTSGPAPRPGGAQQQARPEMPPRTRPQANGAPPPPKAEPRPSSGRPGGAQQQARPETPPRSRPQTNSAPPPRSNNTTGASASAKVGESGPAKPAVKPLYERLGLSDMTASPVAVKKAYHNASMKHHPDKNPGDAGATARFQDISTAFSILSDPEKRKAYDSGRMNEKGQYV
ncbi:Type III effector HopI1 [Pseudomonas syringae pv. cilantro]|uniref:Type III effector HopI1 n=2 Tax=Pseudomonas syringae group TaxID=136849 RepID=A0A0N0X9R6_PSESX|nr:MULTISPECIES: J domain-containing protein [Pseudomonas syringae group]KPC30039.1 Type III effector HopI1 [Pseudomonas syringae pv. cilantro]RMN13451.1 Type III effector HopI1 [Pseudomonas syringae pv. coriandricola]